MADGAPTIEIQEPLAERLTSAAASQGVAVDTFVLDALASHLERDVPRDFPERGRPVTVGIRELRVDFGRDGYVLRYRVRNGEVIITRVFHGRGRRP